MAKKSKTAKPVRKQSDRHYPVQRVLRLGEQTATTAGGRFLNVARCLGLANRRLYRQSRSYSAKIDIDIDSPEALAGVDVYVLRDTWDLHGAYKFAMEAYYNAMKEELEMAKGAHTRWHDFRVNIQYQSDEMLPSVSAVDNTTPAMNSEVITSGDYDYARVNDATGVEHAFILGPSQGANEYHIMTQWYDRDRVQGDPSSQSTTMPYADLQEDTDEANYDLIRVSGSNPPYAAGGEDQEEAFVKVATLKHTASGAMKLSSGFFDAPLGYVVLVSTGFVQSVSRDITGVSLTVQAGDYKGVKAKPYASLEMTPEHKYKVV